MKRLIAIIAFCFFAFVTSPSYAATCFWVGGTGSWSTTNAASWSNASGGTASTCAATGGVPKQSADNATFDGSSGGGTVTVAANMSGVTINSLAAGAFTGTLDFSANNPSMTFASNGNAFNISGTGTRTINCGSGTFTFTSNSAANLFDNTTTTNETLSCGSVTIQMNDPGSNNDQTFVGGGKTYGTLSIASRANKACVVIVNNNTFSNINITAPACIGFNQASTTTISNAFNWTGSSGNVIFVQNNLNAGVNTSATISIPANSSISWAALLRVTFTTNAITCTNCFDLQGNSGVTIVAPTTGGGRIIGG